MNCRDKEIEQLGRKRERVEILNHLSEEIKTLMQTRDQFPPGSEKRKEYMHKIDALLEIAQKLTWRV